MGSDQTLNSPNGQDSSTAGIVTDNEYEGKLVVVNEVLFYVSNYCKGGSAAPENIKRAVTGFYEDSEIWVAKKVLWQFVDTGVLKKFEKRKDTQARSAKDANAGDIIQAFLDMDKVNYEKAVFVAANIRRVPKHHPEQHHDLSVLRRLESLENNSKLVESGSKANQVQISDIVSAIEQLKGSIASNESLINSIAVQFSNIPISSEIVSVPKEGPTLKNNNNVNKNVENKKPIEVSEKGTDIGVRRWSHPTDSKKPHEVKNPLQEENHEKEDDSDYINKHTQEERLRKGAFHRNANGPRRGIHEDEPTSTNRWRKDSYSEPFRKQKNMQIEHSGSRPQALIHNRQPDYVNPKGSTSGGKARDDVFFPSKQINNRTDSSGFSFTKEHYKRMQYKQKKEESNSIRIFIYNVPKKFTEEHVYYHFAGQEVNVLDLWQSSHADARKKSFVIKVSKNQADIIMNDRILEDLYIGAREYNDRSDRSEFV